MTPSYFKQLWTSNDMDRWVEFNDDELERAPISSLTRQFLQIGFPEGAAPFLDFGWRSYHWKFYNVTEAYVKGDSSKSKYWIFGSDGAGNPICFDTANADKIVLLDHEQDFEFMGSINNDVQELAQCLLAYRNFMTIVFEQDDALSLGYRKTQVLSLENELIAINSKVLKESDFWRSELQQLYNECV